MDERSLGKTNIKVSPIGLGTMQFSGGGGLMGKMFPLISQENKNEIIKTAFEGGITHFDTAEIYGNGVSEQSLREALKSNGITDDQVVIGTKWMPFLRTARNIKKSITKRISNLEGYSIDLFMVHMPFSFSSVKGEMNAMADLVDNQKINSVGVSNFSAKRMEAAHSVLEGRGIPLAVNQVQYSLLNRSIETNGILDKAQELGVTITAYTPLGYGVLTGKLHENPDLINQKSRFQRRRIKKRMEHSQELIDTLTDVAKAHEVLPGQVALNWLVNYHGNTVITIPGASKVHHAEQSAGAMRFELTKSEMDEIDNASTRFK